MYYQLELVYVGLILMALVTYRIKNRFLLWPLVLIPPLFLVPLYWIRIDLLTMIFWLPATLAVTWSGISLVINGIRGVVRLLTQVPQLGDRGKFFSLFLIGESCFLGQINGSPAGS